MNGILIINKEKNYTSRDVVNIVSKKLNTKKVGHTGTLDPMAEGVLVLCVGDATKLVELLTCDEKEYIAEVILGISTDTLDITGKILEQKNSIISKEKIEEVLKSYIKSYNQEVPIYSATKVNGKKLYEYARNNEEILLPKKQVEIKNIELLSYYVDEKQTKFEMKCVVSKGTYIRSLIRDIASSLNTIGTMTKLTRTRQGKFKIEDSISLEEFDNNITLKLVEEVLDLYTVKVTDELEKKIQNGCILDNIYPSDIVAFKKEKIIAIYKKYEKDSSKIKPWKMFLRR